MSKSHTPSITIKKMKNYLIITAILLINLANLSAQDRYSVCNDIEIEVLSTLLDWDESLVNFESTPSVDTTQTSSCIYKHEDEIFVVGLVETSYVGFSREDGDMIKIADGSYNDYTGEITYEYFETKGNYIISMSYTTTKSYKGIKELMIKISDLLELNQTISSTNTTFVIEN